MHIPLASPRLLACLLVFFLASGSAWGQEPFEDDGDVASTAGSNIEGWHEDEADKDNWTWFGMGYEMRQTGGQRAGGGGVGGGVGGGAGAGGPGAGGGAGAMNQRGPGGRR